MPFFIITGWNGRRQHAIEYAHPTSRRKRERMGKMLACIEIPDALAELGIAEILRCAAQKPEGSRI